MKLRANLWTLLAGLAICSSCANANAVYGPSTPSTATPTANPSGPTPTPSATVSPLACATAPSASIVVAMAFAIAPNPTSTYGSLNGYGDASDGTVPPTAGPISATTSDTIQFVNVDSYSPTAIVHSAVAFPGASAFPAIPYAFPTAGPTGTSIGSSLWATGLIAPADTNGNPCYSPSFTLPSTGTYLFGDFLYYNTALMRGVIVVSTASSSAAHVRRPRAARILSRP